MIMYRRYGKQLLLGMGITIVFHLEKQEVGQVAMLSLYTGP
jgi:hypothetical protein